MTQQIELKQKSERSLVTPIDVFQAGEFATGVLTSGHIASGINLVGVVSDVRLRLLNLEIYNHEPGWLEICLKDGKIDGPHVAGPYHILGQTGIRIHGDELVGRFCTSGIHGVFLSGYTAQPLSTGVRLTVSFVKDVIGPVT